MDLKYNAPQAIATYIKNLIETADSKGSPSGNLALAGKLVFYKTLVNSLVLVPMLTDLALVASSVGTLVLFLMGG